MLLLTINKIQDYLNKVFTRDVDIRPMKKQDIDRLPLFVAMGYEVFRCRILGQQVALIAYPATESIQPSKLGKEARLIESALGMPVAFVFERLELYARNRLLDQRTSFIVPFHQLYLPFLAISFNESNVRPRNDRDKFSPASQYLLLYHIQVKNIQGFNFRLISDLLNYSAMTITRAAQQLEAFGLVQTERKEEKDLRFLFTGRELWEKAFPYLISPVKMVRYIYGLPDGFTLYEAGDKALARYSTLAGGREATYAIGWDAYKKAKIDRFSLKEGFPNFEADIKLEIWQYDPGLLIKGTVVDPLSLYLSMQDKLEDERVGIALEELINNYKWLKD